jgi:hypothetical protein
VTASLDDARAVVLGLVRGLWVSRALWVAVSLGVPDLLLEGPRDSTDLAKATGMHASSLDRVLRVLCGAGVLAQHPGDRFALTPAGETLCAGRPDSLRAWVTMALGGEYYEAWGALGHTVQTGEAAFPHVFADDVWKYRAQHPDHAALFDAAMASHAGPSADHLLAAYSFVRFGRIVDVGGGDGAMVETILRATPAARAVVFDLPRVVAKARERIRAAGLEGRCESVGGDMFDAVPRGGDVYLLSSVLHDWADEQAVALLRRCRQAMASGSTLVLYERTLPEGTDDRAPQARLADLLMMVVYGGRERTETEFRALLAAAGLRLTRTLHTPAGVAVLEAVTR